MITFAQARRIVENDVPGGAETATVGYESDGRWWPIVLPARLGGRVPGVSKDSGVLTWVSSLDPEYAASRPWGRLDARPNPYTHLPGKHDQRDHGRKGIRKPDIDVTPRTRARRDIEAQARREAQQAVDMHAARAMAELAIEFEELAAKGASPRAMTHRVRARMRRLGLEPSVEQAGQQVTFDPDRHEVIGVRPAAGEQVLVVRPGYVWARPGGEALIERPTVIGGAPSSVTSLLRGEV